MLAIPKEPDQEVMNFTIFLKSFIATYLGFFTVLLYDHIDPTAGPGPLTKGP